MRCKLTRPPLLLALALGALNLGASCSRTPEEPTPITRERTEAKPLAASTAGVANSGTASTVAPDTNLTFPATKQNDVCPADPTPTVNKTMYGHGVATFVTPDGKKHDFKVEVARTEAAQARGLMYRTTLAEDAGMVFEFASPHEASFWMKNTCITLDMVFVDEERRVIGVVTAPPLTLDSRSVPGISKYVVELGGGVAGKNHIGLGTLFVPPSP